MRKLSSCSFPTPRFKVLSFSSPLKAKALAIAALLSGMATLSPAGFTQSQPDQCLIVRKKDGHTMLNLFLFGPPGLLVTAAAKYSTVDSFNLPSAKASYTGGDLQKLSSNNVHVVVVSHKAQVEEVEAARLSCRPPTDGTPVGRTASTSIPALGVFAGTRVDGGAEITAVSPHGLAELSGLHVGDVINSVDGKEIRTPMELAAVISDRAPGTRLRLGYMFYSSLGGFHKETVMILQDHQKQVQTAAMTFRNTSIAGTSPANSSAEKQPSGGSCAQGLTRYTTGYGSYCGTNPPPMTPATSQGSIQTTTRPFEFRGLSIGDSVDAAWRTLDALVIHKPGYLAHVQRFAPDSNTTPRVTSVMTALEAGNTESTIILEALDASLVRITVMDESSAAYLGYVAAFANKYGSPTTRTKQYHNGLGNEFSGEVARWVSGDQYVEIEEECAKIGQSCIVIGSMSADAEIGKLVALPKI